MEEHRGAGSWARNVERQSARSCVSTLPSATPEPFRKEHDRVNLVDF